MLAVGNEHKGRNARKSENKMLKLLKGFQTQTAHGL